MNSKTFCIMPFIHQNIKQEGKVSACWRYPDRIGDYRKDSLETIWNSEVTRNLRKALLNNEMPEGCRSCWDFERSGIESTREKCNKTYQKDYGLDYNSILSELDENYNLPFKPKSIEIRFDNTCNLKCRHCSPTYSSQWETIAFKDDRIKQMFEKFQTGKLEKKHISLPEERFEDFLSTIPYLREVLVAGGEPLQQKKHWLMIEHMKDYAHNIVLSYNSNLTALGIGNWSAETEWSKFKKIKLRVGLDGDDKIYNYFRVNGNLENVVENINKIKQLPNVDLSVTVTVNLYNISRLVDCVKFITMLGCFFHTSMVQYPRPLNPKILPQDIKNKITDEWLAFLEGLEDSNIWDHSFWQMSKRKKEQIDRIKNFGSSAIDYMNSEDYSTYLDESVEYIKLQDECHGTNFEHTYPELSSILKNHSQPDVI
jgi:radical SAM protein with 4Fe4S-binding SPASM domain